MGGKGGGGTGSDVVYVVLERSVAMDLLNALYLALGIIPNGGKKGKGGKGKGGKGGKGIKGGKGGKQ